jgi:hypothetical protein
MEASMQTGEYATAFGEQTLLLQEFYSFVAGLQSSKQQT